MITGFVFGGVTAHPSNTNKSVIIVIEWNI